MYLQLAWRNIWRNPRRTTVILLAVIVGVWSLIIENALMRGIAVGMIENGIATLTGHVQIHHLGYRSDPVIENSMSDPRTVIAAIEKHVPAGGRWAGRVRVNGIASNARHSSGVTIVGIDPVAEIDVSFIGKAVSDGRQLQTEDPHAILVGQALLEKFDTKVGHKLVLMSQDTHQEIVSRAFRIVGVYKSEMRATERQFVFITRQSAQEMLQLKQGLSEVSIIVPGKQAASVASRIKKELSAQTFEVHTWRELLPFMTAYLNILDAFVYIWCLVVFIAMGFGIVNTTLMAVFERIREFGLLKSLGMKPWWIMRQILTESFVLLMVGSVIGNILAFLTVYLLSERGIDLSALAAGAEFAGITRVIYPVITATDWGVANLVVIVLGLLVSIYPAAKAARFTPVEALAHV